MIHMVIGLSRKDVEALEKERIIAALRRTGGNKRLTAEVLKISRGTLYRRLKAYDLGHLIRAPLDLDSL